MTSEQLLELARQLTERGTAYATVTVVRTTPPTSAYVGAQAIVLADGSLHGSVGGGCAREVVVGAALAALRSGEARLVLISNAAGEAAAGVERHAMRCASNGEIEVFVHPHAPAPLLLVLGRTPCADHVRRFAEACGFRVGDGVDPAAAPLLALVATQGEGDEQALEQALASPARRVLLVASRRKAERLREAMRERGVAAERLAALQAPAGPDIGAHHPAHVALAAVAGAVAAWQQEGAAAPAPVLHRPAGASYVNPVCGASVDPASALHVLEWQGQQFWFCCDGCKLEFEREPERYAAIQAAREQAIAGMAATPLAGVPR